MRYSWHYSQLEKELGEPQDVSGRELFPCGCEFQEDAYFPCYRHWEEFTDTAATLAKTLNDFFAKKKSWAEAKDAARRLLEILISE
jgi:hypothetical protein